jgi:DNA-binding LytR/AlgR family response regulator
LWLFLLEVVVVYEKISSFAEKLPENFVRVHKSYIIPFDKIDVIEGNQITIGAEKIPIGNFYKANFLSKIQDSSDK